MFESKEIAMIAIGCLGTLICLSMILEKNTQRIPNWLNLSGIICGLVLAVFDGQWSLHLTGFFLALFIGIFFLKLGMAAAGLVKLLMAAGTIAGPVIPLMTLVLFLLLFGAGALYRKLAGPHVPDSEESALSNYLMSGPLLIALASLLSLILIYRPWEEAL
ncbi:MAG: prepilin peptidase [Planctomycetaceae bacterium]|nr:prepilin peptidase [Planctomycetaceae bacterium]